MIIIEEVLLSTSLENKIYDTKRRSFLLLIVANASADVSAEMSAETFSKSYSLQLCEVERGMERLGEVGRS